MFKHFWTTNKHNGLD